MNKTAIITGSSRGIGRAAARRLAKEGCNICINCVERMDLAEELASEINGGGGRAFAPLEAKTKFYRFKEEM